MMAMLWAQEIMNARDTDMGIALYRGVPRLLKEKVKEILIISGFGKLTVEP